METWAMLILSSQIEKEGKTLPMRIPIIIHRATYPVRYFSNILSFFFCTFFSEAIFLTPFFFHHTAYSACYKESRDEADENIGRWIPKQ